MVTLLCTKYFCFKTDRRQFSLNHGVFQPGTSLHILYLVLPQIFLKYFLRNSTPFLENFLLFFLSSKNLIKILENEFKQ